MGLGGPQRRENTISKFVADLKTGQEAEVKVQKWLNAAERGTGCQYSQSQGKNSDYDLYCIMHGEMTEVKRDMRAHETGNLVFEKALFARSKSETVVYVVQEDAYIFSQKTLWKRLLELKAEGKVKFVMGGDRRANPLLIVPLELVTTVARKVNLKEVS